MLAKGKRIDWKTVALISLTTIDRVGELFQQDPIRAQNWIIFGRTDQKEALLSQIKMNYQFGQAVRGLWTVDTPLLHSFRWSLLVMYDAKLSIHFLEISIEQVHIDPGWLCEEKIFAFLRMAQTEGREFLTLHCIAMQCIVRRNLCINLKLDNLDWYWGRASQSRKDEPFP